MYFVVYCSTASGCKKPSKTKNQKQHGVGRGRREWKKVVCVCVMGYVKLLKGVSKIYLQWPMGMPKTHLSGDRKQNAKWWHHSTEQKN